MSDEQALAKKIFHAMYDNDDMSQWLGIEALEIGAGKAVLRMTVRKEMLNGMDIAHGGITYSLADSALAFASNSHGRKAVSVETSISHIKPVYADDVLTATTKEERVTNKIAIYTIAIMNQQDEKVALFKGTVYRSTLDWFQKEG